MAQGFVQANGKMWIRALLASLHLSHSFPVRARIAHPTSGQIAVLVVALSTLPLSLKRNDVIQSGVFWNRSKLEIPLRLHSNCICSVCVSVLWCVVAVVATAHAVAPNNLFNRLLSRFEKFRIRLEIPLGWSPQHQYLRLRSHSVLGARVIQDKYTRL